MKYQPLADRIRPTTLADVVGQPHILGENGLLRRIIESGNIPNMIFYGPSGVGKTTVASIIANQTSRNLYHLNATNASIQDIKEIMNAVGTLIAPNGALVYLDEIQYFNKKQQQSLLECIEDGRITLIASTTENPYFYVYNAVLSRCTVFEFQPVTAQDIIVLVSVTVIPHIGTLCGKLGIFHRDCAIFGRLCQQLHCIHRFADISAAGTCNVLTHLV